MAEFPEGFLQPCETGAVQGWVVAVTAVAIATGWKLEKGKAGV